jgi:plasmid stability protein
MPSLVIRHLDAELHARLKQKARANHRSLQEEARERLSLSLVQDDSTPGETETLYDIAQRIFGRHGGYELELPDRRDDFERLPPDFSGPEYDR